MRHRETRIQLKCFLTGNWENLYEEFSLQAQTLEVSSDLVPFLQHDPLVHKRLLRSLIFKRARNIIEQPMP